MGDLLLVTGDSSSDSYASRLVSFLLDNGFEGTIHAAAGSATADAGANLVENLVDRSVVGLTEVFGSLPFFFSLMSRLDSLLDEKPIQSVLLMDFPGFNMRFARRARKKGIPLFYYITPQVWAWGRNRISKLRDWFEKLFVIFPFEETMFREVGANAEFVGHPLIKDLQESQDRNLHDLLNLNPEKRILSFFPGSRDHEIDRHLKPMAEVGTRLSRESDSIKPFISAAPTVDQRQFDQILTDHMKEELSIWNGQAYELLRSSTLGVLASGTVTMEAAFAETPMIVGYRTSWLTYFIGQFLVETEEYAMPNLISDSLQIPELIQSDFTVDNLYRTTRNYLEDRSLRDEQREKLASITDLFEERDPATMVGRDLLAYFS
jgi:lipid-A-disaccharide synthase